MKKSIFFSLILLGVISCNKSSQDSSFFSLGKSQSFTCDDPDLIRTVQEKVGQIENIITISKDDELKTCQCEAYAPTLRYKNGHSRVRTDGMWSKGERIYEYSTGTTIKYTAQLKDDNSL